MRNSRAFCTAWPAVNPARVLAALAMALSGCATAALPAAPSQPQKVTSIAGLYKLSTMGDGGRPVYLSVLPGEGPEVRMSLLGHLWTAHPVQHNAERAFVSADPQAPRVRTHRETGILVDRLNDALRHELGELPLPFERASNVRFEAALLDLARGRTFSAVFPDMDADTSDDPSLRIAPSLEITCQGPYCDLVAGEHCQRMMYVVAGSLSELEQDAAAGPAEPIVLQTYSRSAATDGGCEEAGSYAHFDQAFATVLARLDAQSHLGAALFVQGAGNQPYVPRGWSAEQAKRELGAWDREMREADEDAFAEKELARDSLQALANAALAEPQEIAAFLEFAEGMEKRHWDPLLHTRIMEKVIHRAVIANLNADARRLFELLLSRIPPHFGWLAASEGSRQSAQEIAADMLVVAAREKDAALFDSIVRRGLGGEAVISELTHGRVLFNLACWYALARDKDKMLTAMRRALQHGKAPAQFRTDSDFASYQTDADFLRALAPHEAAEAK